MLFDNGSAGVKKASKDNYTIFTLNLGRLEKNYVKISNFLINNYQIIRVTPVSALFLN